MKDRLIGSLTTDRLINWLTFNVIFALLPLMTSIAIHALDNKLSLEILANNSPELLFFALMVSATSLGDLRKKLPPSKSKIGLILKVIWPVLFLGAVSPALFYGAFTLNELNDPPKIDFKFRLLTLSIAMAVVFFTLSATVQTMIGMMEIDGDYT